jgi:hypothetical protein
MAYVTAPVIHGAYAAKAVLDGPWNPPDRGFCATLVFSKGEDKAELQVWSDDREFLQRLTDAINGVEPSSHPAATPPPAVFDV